MADSWNPELYAKFQSERSQPFFDLLSELHSVTHGRIADLGCGPGDLTLKLKDKLGGSYVVGVDNSEAMLQKARLLAAPGSVEFLNSTIENWKPTEKFDVIFSNAALHWCDDHPKLLKHFRSFLKPGGQLAIQMPVNHDYPTHTIAKEMGGEDFSSSILSASEYAQILFDLGFTKQKVYVRVYGHILEDREQVIDWVRGTTLTRFESLLSKAEYAIFLDEYKNRLFKILPNTKPFFYPFKRLFLIANV